MAKMTVLPPLGLVLFLALFAPTAHAGPDGSTEAQDTPVRSESSTTAVKPGPFPKLRSRMKVRKNERLAKRDAPVEPDESRVAVSTAGVDADAPADVAPSGGIWEWVDRMEGEIPTDAQEAGLRAHDEEEEAQAAAPAELKSDHPLFLDLVDPDEFDIPVEVNADVEKWVAYFTGSGRKYYARWLARSTRYRPMMYAALTEAGLPRDLVYLSMIESGYNAHAYSHAAAAGLWQFIPSTARLYDLRVDWWVDERRDPEHAVGAAIAFLSELHEMFGDWRLAWGGYNTGPGRIRRAMRDSGSKDFWTLAHGTYLHSETDNYVPKIMAAAIIGKHPERYGFVDIPFQDELVYDSVKVDGSVALDVLAKCAGTTVEEIKSLNPSLRRYATPPEGSVVRVPVGKQDSFTAALSRVPKNKRVTIVRHRVARGETLGRIAEKYGVGVSAISRANNLKNVNRIYVGMSLVIPKNGAVAPTASRVATSPPTPKASSKQATSTTRSSSYTVRAGDTLSGIATRHGMTTSQLRSMNGISGEKILVGQKLKMNGTAAPKAAAGSVTRKYTVKKGDTLSGIASAHGVKMSALQRTNNITNSSSIRIGQVLNIRTSATAWGTYQVRNGDSLGRIASHHGCSVGDLMAWNNLNNSVIHPGQTLRIRRG